MSLKSHQKIIGKVTNGGREFPIFVNEILADPAVPFVLLSAGMHGNEPASVTALEAFVEEDVTAFADRFNFIVFPKLNPVGLARNTRTNGNDVDLNRNFLSEKPEAEVQAVKNYLASLGKKFSVAIDCHEDPTDAVVPGYDQKENPRGMYLYEVSDAHSRKGHDILQALRMAGFAVAENKIIYGEAAERGLIWAPPSHDPLRHGSFTDEYLFVYTSHTFVIETPTCWPYEKRAAAHRKALALILDLFA